MGCLATKGVKIPHIFKYKCVAMETESCVEIRNLMCLRVCLFMQYCKSNIMLIFCVFYQNCVNMNVGGVNYRT